MNKQSIKEIKTEIARGGKTETRHIYYREVYGLPFGSKPLDTPNLTCRLLLESEKKLAKEKGNMVWRRITKSSGMIV